MKVISSALSAVFAFLIMGEISGFRIHHAASVEIIRANQEEAIPGHDSGDRHSPCQNDEAPTEHVIHHSAGILDGNAFDGFFITVILPSWNAISPVPPIIATPYAVTYQVLTSLLPFETCSDRAPPINL